MDTLFLKKASYISRALAIEAGSQLVENWKNASVAVQKDIRDISTQYDLSIEKMISKTILEEFPEHGFILEESGNINEGAEFQWVIDPIDGTKYFGAQIPLFTVSIGLLHNDIPILGTIYNPISNQLYWSHQGAGTIFLNHNPIKKESLVTNHQPILSLDLSKLNEINDPTSLSWTREKYSDLMKYFYRVRAFGQGSLSLVWLCLGAFDLYLDLTGHTKPVDIWGGLALLTEYGGKYEFLDLGDGRKRIIAAINQKLLTDIKAILMS